ncbi:hypothetical protein PHSY_003935 [Pseudozyma hubeiensis SY62]|uniref:PIN domain-containing protein n=1 Tax=Pseudozyma hubeiensis (strain SY62) TaxID=1305764 RepID=R9PE60_PSEHS|nr:hypothetical protein PHSY_003935 [Pseudozyma hubeiensis SY62]GAC96355.1 hypothetical protein PHSY_003935 [Pseudozyma hubeiensis SY62]
MPHETIQQKAERQQRLSHAMGVMFLQDKVDKLEQDVSKITYPRGVQKTRSAPNHDLTSSHPRHDAAAQVRAQPRAVTGPGLSPDTVSATNSFTNNDAAKVATSIRLVDASVLIFSLRSVHNWSRDQSMCVVIPLEAINTLDLLKKGDEPINLAARKATRWLEDKIAISTQDGDLMLTQPAPGIFAQKEHFRAASIRIADARLARQQQAQSDASGAASADEVQVKDAFNAAEAPRYLRELLSVCLYCQAKASSASNFAVAIAYPPDHLQEKMVEAQAASNDKPTYLNRTDGRATEAWLDAYGIPFQVVATSKTWTGEKLSSRFRNESSGDQHSLGSSDDLRALGQAQKGQQRRSGSPTPSASSSGSFKSELSGLSMLSSHRSPRHGQESRFGSNTFAPPHRSIRCMSTAASNPATEANAASSAASEDEEGPIIARPSSAASSRSSLFSSLTTSTHDEWSSQTSASFSSNCGARVVRRGASPSPTPTGSGAVENDASPRLTSRTLHKTRSGAEKMEEYLRRLEAGAGAGTATPTPGANR